MCFHCVQTNSSTYADQFYHFPANNGAASSTSVSVSTVVCCVDDRPGVEPNSMVLSGTEGGGLTWSFVRGNDNVTGTAHRLDPACHSAGYDDTAAWVWKLSGTATPQSVDCNSNWRKKFTSSGIYCQCQMIRFGRSTTTVCTLSELLYGSRQDAGCMRPVTGTCWLLTAVFYPTPDC